MARIAGVTIPSEKRVVVALTYIYGIGPSLSADMLVAAKIDPNTRTKDLTMDQESVLRSLVEKYAVEGDLRRKVQLDVKRLQDIGSYRGFRHRRRLPVRGQRTKTNARTKRGKRVAIAGKKKEGK